MRIAVRAYSRIEASINRWYSTVLRTRQFCSNVPCSGPRVSELTDRKSQTTLNIILQTDLTEQFCYLTDLTKQYSNTCHGMASLRWTNL